MAGPQRLIFNVRPVPAENSLAISLRLILQAGESIELALPTWIPGSYLIREFSRYLGELSAIGPEDEPVPMQRVDKARWRITARSAGEYAVSYSVFAHELTVRSPHVDSSHAFFNGANVFLYPPEREAEFAIELEEPIGWKTFAPLPVDDDGRFVTDDWDRLADTAFECGPHTLHSFEVSGVQHRLVFWGDEGVRIDYTKLVEHTRKIVEYHEQFFGSLPYDRYDFVFHVTPSARGGLEHLYGTTLATPWAYFEDEEKYADLLTLITHEHFHAWNGKRIRPVELGPFDYQNENYSKGLWVVEGFTSYFDEYNTYRAGLIDRDTYLQRLCESFDRLDAIPGRRMQSIADASYDAWIRLYRPDEDSVNRTVSYYLKGSIVSLLLDHSIRAKSGGDASLHDLMKHLYKQFMNDGLGYDEQSLAATIVDVTGVDIRAEIERWVYGTDELPIDEILVSLGLRRVPKGEAKTAILGVHASHGADGMSVRSVLADGPNADTDLQPGDVVIAVNGRKVTSDNLSQLLISASDEQSSESRAAQLHVFRLGRLHSVAAKWVYAPPKTTLELIDDITDATRRLRDAWLTNQAAHS